MTYPMEADWASVLATSLTPSLLAWIMIAAAVTVLPVLLWGPNAPYGRFSATGWGPLVPARAAWVAQECWSLAVPAAYYGFVAAPGSMAAVIADRQLAAIAAMFLLHYLNRDVVYPLRMRPGRPTPLAVAALAAAFCVFNGALQTWAWEERARVGASGGGAAAAVPAWQFILGAGLWLVGFLTNIHADATLRSLRPEHRPRGEASRGASPRPSPTADDAVRHEIPRGGAFRFVSAANYFGECVEWTGWALAAGSLPAAAFAFFTWANLLPRALRYHRWYLEKFDDYPAGRRAIIPFLL